jgi:hypothetical protein
MDWRAIDAWMWSMVLVLSLVLADAEEAVLRSIETRFADGFR